MKTARKKYLWLRLSLLVASGEIFAQGTALNAKLLASIEREDSSGVEGNLKAGADANAKSPDGSTALQIALRKNPFEMGIETRVYLLLKNGARIEGLSLNEQVRLYSFVSRMTIETGDDHISVVKRDHSDHVAIGKENLKKITGQKITINTQDSEGNTPLMIATITPTQAQHFQWLLDNGADIKIKNKQGKTALDIFQESAKQYRINSAEDGGFDGAAEYHAKNEKLLKRSEQILTKASKSEDAAGTGILIGKVFSSDGKSIQITGNSIAKLAKGSKIIVRSSSGTISATVGEILHTKAKAKLTSKGIVEKGDAVYLAK